MMKKQKKWLSICPGSLSDRRNRRWQSGISQKRIDERRLSLDVYSKGRRQDK